MSEEAIALIAEHPVLAQIHDDLQSEIDELKVKVNQLTKIVAGLASAITEMLK